MEDLILILSDTREICTKRVIDCLLGFGQRIVKIDVDDLFEKNFSLNFSNRTFAAGTQERYTFDRFKSIWYRRPQGVTLPSSMPKINEEFTKNEYRSALWSLYTNLLGFWMNNPVSCQPIEHNKFYQLREAAKVGLKVPDTIISTNPDELIAFSKVHGDRLAIKVLYPTVIRDGSKSNKFIFTNLVTTEQLQSRQKEIRVAPVFAQEYVEKAIEFRVTIVGGLVFACAIYSQNSEQTRHDWRRYDFENVKHEAWQLPKETKVSLLRLMEKLNLCYGAIDMILTPSGKYVFLEINPSGQWEWIEELTKMPISKAIAELLVNPSTLKQN